MDQSCKKVVPIWGTKSVPEIGTKSGAKVHKLVLVSGTDLVPKNGTKNGPKTGTRMHFVYDFIHFEQFCHPLPVGSQEPLFWFQKTEPFCGAEASILVPKNGTDLVPEFGTRIATRRRGF